MRKKWIHPHLKIFVFEIWSRHFWWPAHSERVREELKQSLILRLRITLNLGQHQRLPWKLISVASWDKWDQNQKGIILSLNEGGDPIWSWEIVSSCWYNSHQLIFKYMKIFCGSHQKAHWHKAKIRLVSFQNFGIFEFTSYLEC